MPQETQPADLVARRKAALVASVIGLVAMAAIFAATRYLQDIKATSVEDPGEALARLSTVIKMLAIGTGFALLSVAAWLFRLSWRIYRAERFPPLGMRVIRRTRVVRGEAARVRAFLGFAIAGMIGVLGYAAALMLWRLTTRLPVLW